MFTVLQPVCCALDNHELIRKPSVLPQVDKESGVDRKRKLSSTLNRENDYFNRLPEASPLSSSSLEENLRSPKNDGRPLDLGDELGMKKIKHKHSKHKHKHGKRNCKKHKRSHLDRQSSELGKLLILLFIAVFTG